jgi:hypothetical protein
MRLYQRLVSAVLMCSSAASFGQVGGLDYQAALDSLKAALAGAVESCSSLTNGRTARCSVTLRGMGVDASTVEAGYGQAPESVRKATKLEREKALAQYKRLQKDLDRHEVAMERLANEFASQIGKELGSKNAAKCAYLLMLTVAERTETDLAVRLDKPNRFTLIGSKNIHPDKLRMVAGDKRIKAWPWDGWSFQVADKQEGEELTFTMYRVGK